jgi:tetratricopeptide (TPR) repeat protein
MATNRPSAGRHSFRAALVVIVSGLILVLSLPLALTSQVTPGDPELDSVPEPVLDSFDPVIQEQLHQRRGELDTVVAQGGAERLELMELYGAMGELYFLYQLWEPAEACFRNAHRLAPRDFRWPYFLGVIFSRQGDLESAIAELEAAEALRPQSVPARIRLGRLYFEVGNLERAEKEFRQAVELDPDAAAAHHGLGRVAQDRGDPRTAIAHYERALELQPAATSIHGQLGIAYRDLGDRGKARYHVQLNKYDPVRFADPLVFSLSAMVEGAHYFIRMGTDLLEKGDLAGAIAAFREAVARDPEEKLAQYNLGVSLLEAGETESAFEHLQRAAELDPDFRDAHFNLGKLLLEMGRFEQAASHFRRALEIDPQDGEARLEWALAESRGGRGSEAVEELEAELAADPENPSIGVALGVVLAEVGRPAEARARLEQVLEGGGDAAVRARAELQLGMLLQAENEAEAALGRFQEARLLDPELLGASSAAGIQLARMGRFREAAESFSLVVEARPGDETARFSLAMAQVLAGREREARDTLEQGLELLPDSRALRHLLARLLAAAVEDTVRDGPRAVELAQEIFNESADAESAETVAMALAEAGDFDEAVRWQETAIGLLPDGAPEGRFSKARKRRVLYQSGNPCRAPWRDG